MFLLLYYICHLDQRPKSTASPNLPRSAGTARTPTLKSFHRASPRLLVWGDRRLGLPGTCWHNLLVSWGETKSVRTQDMIMIVWFNLNIANSPWKFQKRAVGCRGANHSAFLVANADGLSPLWLCYCALSHLQASCISRNQGQSCGRLGYRVSSLKQH